MNYIKYINNGIIDKDLHELLIKANKTFVPSWNINIFLQKSKKLNLFDDNYNAYLLKNDNDNIGFFIISNADGEDLNCSDMKIYQKEIEDQYWLTDFFIFPEYRNKGFGTKAFELILKITKDKNLYFYTDKTNYAQKIYNKYMFRLPIIKGLNENKIPYCKIK